MNGKYKDNDWDADDSGSDTDSALIRVIGKCFKTSLIIKDFNLYYSFFVLFKMACRKQNPMRSLVKLLCKLQVLLRKA